MNIAVNYRRIRQAGNYYYDFFNNEMYMLLFYHNSSVVVTWTEEEAKENYNESKYSVLSHLTNYYRTNSKFQFLLEYAGYPYLIWRQTKNPLEETTVDGTGNFVSGFQPIHVPFQNFTGLAVSTDETFLDGTSQKSTWFYSIGILYPSYDTSLPGPIDTKNHFVKTVALWVRFPVQNRLTCTMRRHISCIFLFTFFFISK